MPTKQEIIAAIQGGIERAEATFSSLTDEQLARNRPRRRWWLDGEAGAGASGGTCGGASDDAQPGNDNHPARHEWIQRQRLEPVDRR